MLSLPVCLLLIVHHSASVAQVNVSHTHSTTQVVKCLCTFWRRSKPVVSLPARIPMQGWPNLAGFSVLPGGYRFHLASYILWMKHFLPVRTKKMALLRLSRTVFGQPCPKACQVFLFLTHQICYGYAKSAAAVDLLWDWCQTDTFEAGKLAKTKTTEEVGWLLFFNQHGVKAESDTFPQYNRSQNSVWFQHRG